MSPARKTAKTASKTATKSVTKAPDLKTAALAAMEDFDLLAGDAATYAPDFTTEDRAINFLRIAQAMSPVAKRLEPEYIKGCEEGTFYTTISRNIANELTFLPVYWTKNFTWWKPRNAGGGLVRNHGQDKGASKILAAVKNPDNGRLELRGVVPGVPIVEVVEADLYFGFWIHEDGTREECVLSLTSTQLTKARKWNSKIHSFKHPKTGAPMPLFARAYQLSSVGESNDKGSWAGLVVEEGPLIMELGGERWDQLYAACKSLADDCLRGTKVVVVDAEYTVSDDPAPVAEGEYLEEDVPVEDEEPPHPAEDEPDYIVEDDDVAV